MRYLLTWNRTHIVNATARALRCDASPVTGSQQGGERANLSAIADSVSSLAVTLVSRGTDIACVGGGASNARCTREEERQGLMRPGTRSLHTADASTQE
ncbi:hypothetical protein [Sorangium sp. So ce1153]|uniref:hypothetical protein n=1 Tax=Sorangium sp. So ce1153 TaxID=3133333 RepID=UPI003F630435